CRHGFGGLRGDGKPDGEDCTAVRFVLTGDLPIVVLNHTVGGAQSKAGAFADGLRGVEGVEDPLWIANAGTIVGELDHNLVVFSLQCNDKLTAADFFQGINCVLDDLQGGLQELVAITPDRGKATIGNQVHA